MTGYSRDSSEKVWEVDYSLLNPTGNLTLLIETPVPEEMQPEIARRLMAVEPSAEQAGFVSFEENCVKLRMAGGEFCGNASMSAAALYLKRKGLREGRVSVHVSGTAEPVEVVISPDLRECMAFRGTVAMPRPESLREVAFPGGQRLPVVFFPGIAHVILERKIEPGAAERLAEEWCGFLGTEALGLMFLNVDDKTLTPLVYVPAAGTLFWESSCASGTSAAGTYYAEKTGKRTELSLSQPGGILMVSAEPGGSPFLTGTVRLVKTAAGIQVL